MGNSCGTRRRGKSQFKKGSDWWKFCIWNRVMGSKPIRIQLKKILQENLVGFLVGNSCGNILQKILAQKSCGKSLQEILVGNPCRKSLLEILVGNPCRTRRRGKSQFKKGSDWWKYSMWNRVMGSQPISIQLGKLLWENLVENLVGKSCRKLLQENLVGNLVGKSCKKFLQKIL